MVVGVCNLSIIPLRAEPSHRSELVSQIVFAERFEVLKVESDWTYIRLLSPHYEGWVQSGQFVIDKRSSLKNEEGFVVDLTGAVATRGDVSIDLVPGTRLSGNSIALSEGDEAYRVSSPLRKPELSDFAIELPKLIAYYKDRPYLWGGRSYAGIDCSGLSQAIYRHFGVDLPRDAYQQVQLGENVDFIAEIKPGDLAFFDNAEGRITHVGIMVDQQTIFHASVSVRLDSMDAQGIFNVEQHKYTHNFRIVKRYF